MGDGVVERIRLLFELAWGTESRPSVDIRVCVWDFVAPSTLGSVKISSHGLPVGLGASNKEEVASIAIPMII